MEDRFTISRGMAGQPERRQRDTDLRQRQQVRRRLVGRSKVWDGYLLGQGGKTASKAVCWRVVQWDLSWEGQLLLQERRCVPGGMEAGGQARHGYIALRGQQRI